MRVLALIPARGGSQGIAHKNIRLLAGKPLIAHTIACAQAARGITRLVVSTDDEAIAQCARSLGAQVPFMRPSELARHETPMLPVVQHALQQLDPERIHYDALLLLQPTQPLRKPSDIEGALALLEASGADSVISFTQVSDAHPARMKWVDPATREVQELGFSESAEGTRRQELPPIYLREGSIYLSRIRSIDRHHSLKGLDCRAWLMPRAQSCTLDEEIDWVIAEALMQAQKNSLHDAESSHH